MYNPLLRFAIYLVLVSFLACKPDSDSIESLKEVNIHLPGEPDRINPLLSKSTHAVPIEKLIFQNLADFEPYTLDFKPVLAKALPIKEDIPGKGGAYDIEIRSAAKWSDGKEVTAHDFVFSINAALNPFVNAGTIKAYIAEIEEVIIDPENAKKMRVIVEKDYILSREVILNLSILPEHVYDPNLTMRKYDLKALKKGEGMEDDAALKNFADAFNAPENSRNVLVGSGPYRLEKWETGQRITLVKDPTWWANGLAATESVFTAKPERLNFQIIPDENTATTALKDGNLDLISSLSPNNFAALKANETYKDSFDFLTPEIMRYFYLSINNKSAKLNDKNVRRALTHLLDMDQVINTLMNGIALRTIGPINPRKSYYNNALKPIQFDPEKAKTLLKEAGWTDSNGNGTLDKNVNGVLEEMQLRIFVSKGELGKKLALILKDEAIKAGVSIDILPRDFSTTIADLRKQDFELAALVQSQSPFLNDPFQSWHTSSQGTNGSNYSGFGNQRSDEVIEQIRVTMDEGKRKELYNEFQSIIYDEQPVIFLFSPAECLVARKSMKAKGSSVRPGYSPNYFGN